MSLKIHLNIHILFGLCIICNYCCVIEIENVRGGYDRHMI